jgi:site-specific DNA-methyltransferase (adenine-specific)
MTAEIINADVLEGLRGIPDNTFHCCVTSPPYWGLRQYLFDKALVLRYDLTQEEQDFLFEELKKRGIKPRRGDGKVIEGGALEERNQALG